MNITEALKAENARLLEALKTKTFELEIEAALERVRAASMAMRDSSALSGIIYNLYGELTKLDAKLDRAFIMIVNPENKGITWWMAGQEGLLAENGFFVQMNPHPSHLMYLDYCKQRKKKWTYLFEGKEKRDWDRFGFSKTELAKLPEPIKAFMSDAKKVHLSGSSDQFGSLVTGSFEPLPEEQQEIISRFSITFNQAYIRFLDLQKAEAQVMEATKRASVDRVRAEIASMRTTSDLERIQPLIWNELKILNVPFIRCGVFIIDEEKQKILAFLSTPDGKSMATFRLPYYATEQSRQIVAHWQQKQLFKDHMDEAAFAEYTKNLVQQGAVGSDEKYVTENRPTDLYLHFLPFLQGMLYVGNDAPLKEQELQLVQNLAEAFSTAYARYEDFTKLEAAKSAVEAAMDELRATQSQLVQQEKLASLGQLTAGIAHEIKNPLNFVNNFSEVSIEMIEEVLEEREKTRLSDRLGRESTDGTLVDDILKDIKVNLQKIHKHGTRANGIVTSMLLHARGGSGKKEPTDLNALVREYVNLCFHGMRAGKNPIHVEIVLDLDTEMGLTPLVKEDFTRVIINLCTNAFDAMRSKSISDQSGNYVPRLRITTKKEAQTMTMVVEDNGPGIPDEIKDKIMQPFFTTKKGTEGTGLGLSISHDIVKAHGGSLNVEIKESEGSAFVIQLPIV
ncbi:MAG: hypothetical protein IPN20_09130 [Haliscomenobacter sp.]|nr:hypothetical protein [Haliscomenobacter sp.]